MNVHDLPLYACAAAVVGPGIKVLNASLPATASGQEPQTGARSLLRAWRPAVPVVAGAMVVVMAGFNLVQTAWPELIGHLQRQPGGAWWRAVTALLVESSGWVQLLFNLAALIAVAPVAQRVLGPAWTLVIYLASGIAAQAVSMASWSPYGGGNSVAICGLVGALAAAYALRGPDAPLRRLALLVPAAGLVLCAMTNNHGVGLLAGSLLGAGLATVDRTGRRIHLPVCPETAAA
ncbi:rhomboid family intramembrane serine protease [Streptomyces sp. SID4946]|nr:MULTISPECIES: rhomboid family intramembrane serine protease [unclassified Streptomyces]MYQ95089.1 rhomboid family intramembrane serine protease [Streptomyces sp. SID4946]MYR91332.1 rhomboid family intramembrane serine protease [Streptomyces sp. SID685]SCF61990.1 rhomboid protease GluP [Streptomyces sp. LamerLS-31b]SCF93478.1 rhomboid protease GluP [Streptomyces sp. DconLS]